MYLSSSADRVYRLLLGKDGQITYNTDRGPFVEIHIRWKERKRTWYNMQGQYTLENEIICLDKIG